MANEYATLEELKNHIIASGDANFTEADDGNLSIALEAASRWIDEQVDTTFYERTETLHFTAQWRDLLYVPDLLSITSLKTDDRNDGSYTTAWAETDYWLEPRNAQRGSQPKPYRQIRARRNGNYRFPTGVEYGVEIAGSWGYCTEANRPVPIKQATLLIAHRLWRRKDAIFGVAGAPTVGGIPLTVVQAQIQADEDVMMMLESVDMRGF